MKKSTIALIALTVYAGSITLYAQVPVKPAHVIIVMEENYAYSEIIGSALAPTFTALSKTSYTANFTQDFAITHPSEPNYICLFSGSQQGVTSDLNGPDSTAPFNDCNLGSSLLQNGYTFIGYGESMPSVGYMYDAGNYYTKHCPWINWIGYNTNPDTIPIICSQPFTSFPDSNHYSSLPTVSWVTPNIVNDMHNPVGNPSVAIPNGDAWFNAHIMPLVRWASNPVNNTVVIATWDEDDGTMGNNITLLVSSGLVTGGNYITAVNHFCVLKTIEDMYNLPKCGSSDSSAAIDLPNAIWKVSAINSITGTSNRLTIWPNPATNELNVKITSGTEANAKVGIYDITGRKVKDMPVQLKPGENKITINTCDIPSGIYSLNITGNKINIDSKFSIAK